MDFINQVAVHIQQHLAYQASVTAGLRRRCIHESDARGARVTAGRPGHHRRPVGPQVIQSDCPSRAGGPQGSEINQTLVGPPVRVARPHET